MIECSSGRDLDMESFKDPGWCCRLVHLEGRAAASATAQSRMEAFWDALLAQAL